MKGSTFLQDAYLEVRYFYCSSSPSLFKKLRRAFFLRSVLVCPPLKAGHVGAQAPLAGRALSPFRFLSKKALRPFSSTFLSRIHRQTSGTSPPPPAVVGEASYGTVLLAAAGIKFPPLPIRIPAPERTSSGCFCCLLSEGFVGLSMGFFGFLIVCVHFAPFCSVIFRNFFRCPFAGFRLSAVPLSCLALYFRCLVSMAYVAWRVGPPELADASFVITGPLYAVSIFLFRFFCFGWLLTPARLFTINAFRLR